MKKWYTIGSIVAILFLMVSYGLVASRTQVTAGSYSIPPVQTLSPILLDPGFEGTFIQRGAPEVMVAASWNEWYNSGGQLHRPEFKAEKLGQGASRVWSGEQAQKTFTTYALHDGGVWQIVNGLQENHWYRFQCMVWNWSSQEDNPNVSSNPGKGSSLVGVNPWGNAWPNHYTTIWGKAALEEYDQWVSVSVLFQAWSPKAALLTRGIQEYPVKHGDWYWDGCSLIGVDIGCPPTSTPPPHTPVPTSECRECAGLDDIVSAMETVVASRDPVKWPK
jgi:hypothetical protein